jgi:hypothetical protein
LEGAYGAKILLIEDEEKLARFVELELCYEGTPLRRPLTAGQGSIWQCREVSI